MQNTTKTIKYLGDTYHVFYSASDGDSVLITATTKYDVLEVMFRNGFVNYQTITLTNSDLDAIAKARENL